MRALRLWVYVRWRIAGVEWGMGECGRGSAVGVFGSALFVARLQVGPICRSDPCVCVVCLCLCACVRAIYRWLVRVPGAMDIID